MSASSALVLRLLFPSGPPTVRWRVIPIVVDALDRAPRRAVAHVGKEIRELVPAFADFDATRAIILECWLIRVLAAAQHSSPDLVFRPPLASGRISMRSATSYGQLLIEAAAALREPAPQIAQRDDALSPAYTATSPQRIAAIGAFPADHDQSSETFTQCRGVSCHDSVR